MTISLDVHLEDHAYFALTGDGAFNLNVSTKGDWSLGSQHGSGAAFKVGAWHTLQVSVAAGWVAATVDGKLLANATREQHLTAPGMCDQSSFPVDLTGKQYMGLGKGPASADTVDKCQQACCDAGPACKIWQFSNDPSQKPDCWIGSATSFNKGDGYISRGRNLPGFKLMVQLSRYIFASIDNFAIAQM